MKVKIFHLEYGAKNDPLFTKNILSSGYPEAEYQRLDIAPLAKALNSGLREFQNGYDFIGFLANDIQEPQDWLLKRLTHMEENPECGITAIYPGEIPTPGTADIIGNYLIRKELFFTIGFFTEEFEDYGPIDLDYCTRSRVAGFSTCYVGTGAIHHDAKDDTIYGFSKSEAVKKNWPIHVQNVNWYLSSKKAVEIIYPEYIINQKEWP